MNDDSNKDSILKKWGTKRSISNFVVIRYYAQSACAMPEFSFKIIFFDI